MYDYYLSVAASSLWSLLLEASYSITENGAAFARHMARGSEIVEFETEDGVAINGRFWQASLLLSKEPKGVRLLLVGCGFFSMEPTTRS